MTSKRNTCEQFMSKQPTETDEVLLIVTCCRQCCWPAPVSEQQACGRTGSRAAARWGGTCCSSLLAGPCRAASLPPPATLSAAPLACGSSGWNADEGHFRDSGLGVQHTQPMLGLTWRWQHPVGRSWTCTEAAGAGSTCLKLPLVVLTEYTASAGAQQQRTLSATLGEPLTLTCSPLAHPVKPTGFVLMSLPPCTQHQFCIFAWHSECRARLTTPDCRLPQSSCHCWTALAYRKKDCTCFRSPSAFLASPAAPCSGPAPDPVASFAAPVALSARPLACSRIHAVGNYEHRHTLGKRVSGTAAAGCGVTSRPAF